VFEPFGMFLVGRSVKKSRFGNKQMFFCLFFLCLFFLVFLVVFFFCVCVCFWWVSLCFTCFCWFALLLSIFGRSVGRKKLVF